MTSKFQIMKLLLLMKLSAVIANSSLLFHSRGSFSKGNLVDTHGCTIPNINHFNPESLANYVPHNFPYNCPGKSNIIYFITNDRIAVINEILKKEYGVDLNTFTCQFREIMKDGEKDSHKYGVIEYFDYRVPIIHDHVVVYCRYNRDKSGHIHEFVSLFPKRRHLEERYEQSLRNSPPVEPLNVYIVHICSLSRLNFMRHLVKTYHYLKNTLEAIELKGYSKISSGSFANAMPYLTGQHYTKFWNHNVNTPVYFDDVDFIWNHYKDKGYRTVYVEDMERYGTFNWDKKGGFRRAPVDYYYRPVTDAMENSNMARRSKKFCFHSKLRIGGIWEYLKRYAKTIEEKYLSFAFTFVSDIVHEYHNNAGHLDIPLLDLITELHDSGVLSRSILIISSDHGLRVGKQRMTLTGAYEDRMPACFMVFPKWFKTKYPDAYRNLKINENRLTTHFDIHATLLHFPSFTKTPPTNNAYKYGISLFSEIPESRTCEDAGIDDHACPCKSYVPDNENRLKHHIAEFAIRKINELVSTNQKCHTYTLDRIIHFSSSEYSKKDQTTHYVMKYYTDYLVVFVTLPGDGVFESTIRYDKSENLFAVVGEINRVNSFRPTKQCVGEDSYFSVYCECK